MPNPDPAPGAPDAAKPDDDKTEAGAGEGPAETPASVNEGRLGPGADPAEGKR